MWQIPREFLLWRVRWSHTPVGPLCGVVKGSHMADAGERACPRGTCSQLCHTQAGTLRKPSGD